MLNHQYNRFFDLVGNEAVNEITEMALENPEQTFVNECVIAVEDIDGHEYIHEELISLAYDFWGHINYSRQLPCLTATSR